MSVMQQLDRTQDGRGHRVDRLPILILHAHSRCNCRCVMCDIWKDTSQRELTPEDVEKLLPGIEKLRVETIVFSGGEPLMNRHFPAIAARLRQMKIRLILLSTGMLLQRQASEVAGCIDEIIVSLDGPPGVHDAIRRVPGAYAALDSGIQAVRACGRVIPIRARTTVQKANRLSLRGTVDSAKHLGLDSISFLAVDTASQAFNRELVWPLSRQMEVGLSRQEIEELEAEINLLIANYDRDIAQQFISEDPGKLRRIVSHFRAHAGQEEPVAPMCNAPWHSAVVELDGSVRPCFFQPAIGNLSDGSLDEIINGESALKFRRCLDVAVNATCRRCVCSLNYREPGLPTEGVAHSPV